MIAAAWGDLLGGVTEFHSSPSQLFSYHPHGVLSIDNFTDNDWSKFPAWYREKNIAPYTDDTAMALVVADYLIQSKASTASTVFNDQWMAGIASAFIGDMNNPYGWRASFRAPGISTMNALTLLSNNKKTEWPSLYKKFENNQGCGSIMRAYPCGLLCGDCLKFAKDAAIAQSKVTHNSSIANASCAALSAGIGMVMRLGVTFDAESYGNRYFLVKMMIAIANEVDETFVVTAKIDEAYQAGREMEALLTKYKITTPEQLIEELKKERSEIGRLHFEVCKKFPGWKADDALAATVYVVSAAIEVPYLAIILGVHSTGDSDSIASLAGALIGAWHGKKALPATVWENEVPRIEGIDTIRSYAKQIYDLSSFNCGKLSLFV
jgi:ADP-ribosylglycohydrolase